MVQPIFTTTSNHWENALSYSTDIGYGHVTCLPKGILADAT